MTTFAIVPAAGAGTRLGAGVPKAFAKLAGTPLVVRAIEGLTASKVVDAIIVAVPEGRTDEAQLILGGGEIPVHVVAGGAERVDSVRNALDAAREAVKDAEYVLVHDAARPLTPPELIARVVDALRSGHSAAIPALPVADTIKAVDSNGVVLGTPERSGLRAIQTPQGFAVATLRRAYERAGGAEFTDDASLVEHIGAQVQTVEGDPLAFKITTPLDLELAHTVLADRE